MARVMEEHGYQVISTDLIYRGYGNEKPVDFLHEPIADFDGDIITNPPYKYALQFVEKALERVKTGRKVAMFLKLQFLEGKSRKQFFLKHPPKTVYVSSSRLICAMNGEFEKYPSSEVAYAIVVKIPFNWINVMGNKLGDKMGNKVGNKSASSTEQNIHLNETQLMILNFIRDNNNITKKQLQEKTSKSKTTVDNTISFLREHGLIERIGSNKTGYWKVND